MKYLSRDIKGNFVEQLSSIADVLVTAWDTKDCVPVFEECPLTLLFNDLALVPSISEYTEVKLGELTVHKKAKIVSTSHYDFEYMSKHRVALSEIFKSVVNNNTHVTDDTIIVHVNTNTTNTTNTTDVTNISNKLLQYNFNLQLVVFTDDEKWCRQQFDLLFNRFNKVTYSATHSNIQEKYDQFTTMISCKQYLGDSSLLSQLVNFLRSGCVSNNTQQISPNKTAIKLSSDPQTSGRLCNKMFQLSHLMAMKMEIKDKFNRHADIHFDVGDYKYFTGIYATVDASCNTLPKWEQSDYKFASIPTPFLESGVMVKGYVQSHKFFQQYADKIINYWLSLPFGNGSNGSNNIDKQFAKLKGTARNVVSIHVRRTDYVTDKNHPSLPIEYYNNAIALMEARRIHSNKEETKYLVFSDDKEWCKEQKWEVPVTIVDLQNEYKTGAIVNSDYFELLLMARCNSFIIANSTYSWWGAYLSKSRDVIYPDIWFGGSIRYLETDDMFPDHWTSVTCDQKVDIKDLGVFLRESKSDGIKDAKYYDERITKAWRLKRYSEGFKAILQLNALKTEDATKYLKEHQQRLTANISYFLPN